MKKIFLFLIASSFSPTWVTADQGATVTYTFGGQKYDSSWGYNPWVHTNNSTLNQGLAQSYQYGNPSYLNTKIAEFQNSKAAALNQIRLSQQIRDQISSSVAGHLARMRDLSLEQDKLERVSPHLNPIFEQMATQPEDTIGLVDKINHAEEVSIDEGDEGRLVRFELTRIFLNPHGIIKGMPFSRSPEAFLYTKRNTHDGHAIRARMNQVIAGEAVVLARCAGNAGMQVHCSAFSDLSDQVKVSLLLADRLAYDDHTAEFQNIMKATAPVAEFLRGFAQGVAKSGIQVITTFKTLAESDLGQVLSTLSDATYHAIVNYEDTWEKIRGHVREKVDIVLYGSAEQVGELTGQIAFEVTTMLAGGALAKRAQVVLSTAIETATIRAAAETAGFAKNANFNEVRKAISVMRKHQLAKEERTQILRAFGPETKVLNQESDRLVRRYFLDNTYERSNWLTDRVVQNPIMELALDKDPLRYKPSDFKVKEWIIPKGTTTIEGPIAPNFGKPGGGWQIYVPNPEVLKSP